MNGETTVTINPSPRPLPGPHISREPILITGTRTLTILKHSRVTPARKDKQGNELLQLVPPSLKFLRLTASRLTVDVRDGPGDQLGDSKGAWCSKFLRPSSTWSSSSPCTTNICHVCIYIYIYVLFSSWLWRRPVTSGGMRIVIAKVYLVRPSLASSGV